MLTTVRLIMGMSPTGLYHLNTTWAEASLMSFRMSAKGILPHSSINANSSTARIPCCTLRAAIRLWRQSHTCSIELMLGERAGQSLRCIVSRSRNSFTTLSLCGQALSSINTNSGYCASKRTDNSFENFISTFHTGKRSITNNVQLCRAIVTYLTPH